MKSIGITRAIDNLGRIVIPMEIRKNLRIRSGDKLEIYTNKDMICLRKLHENYTELIKSSLEELDENWSDISNAQQIKDKLHDVLELLSEKE